MFRKRFLLGAALLAVTACTAKTPDANATSKAPDTATDEANLKTVALSWFDLYNKADAAGVANLYAEDGIIMPPGMPAANGRPAIQSYLTGDIAGAKAAGTSDNGDVNGVGVSGDMGWVSGTWSTSAPGGAVVDKGKFVSVYKRINSEWKLIRDTWNSDMATAAAAPPKPKA